MFDIYGFFSFAPRLLIKRKLKFLFSVIIFMISIFTYRLDEPVPRTQDTLY